MPPSCRCFKSRLKAWRATKGEYLQHFTVGFKQWIILLSSPRQYSSVSLDDHFPPKTYTTVTTATEYRVRYTAWATAWMWYIKTPVQCAPGETRIEFFFVESCASFRHSFSFTYAVTMNSPWIRLRQRCVVTAEQRQLSPVTTPHRDASCLPPRRERFGSAGVVDRRPS